MNIEIYINQVCKAGADYSRWDKAIKKIFSKFTRSPMIYAVADLKSFECPLDCLQTTKSMFIRRNNHRLVIWVDSDNEYPSFSAQYAAADGMLRWAYKLHRRALEEAGVKNTHSGFITVSFSIREKQKKRSNTITICQDI